MWEWATACLAWVGEVQQFQRQYGATLFYSEMDAFEMASRAGAAIIAENNTSFLVKFSARVFINDN